MRTLFPFNLSNMLESLNFTLSKCILTLNKYHIFDDIFVLFTSPKHLEAFRNFLSGRHANMSFTIEHEKQNRFSFLDIEIIREDITFTTSVYRKPTCSGVYTHFDSFLPSTSISLVLFTHSLINTCEFALIGLNYTMN